MPVRLTVRATVVDMSVDRPRHTDVFLIDTQVWYWLAYARASSGSMAPQRYQIRTYPQYVHAATATGARLRWCGLSLAELAHLIEANERSIFKAAHPNVLAPRAETKAFRHNFPAERARVGGEISAAWSIVESLGDPLIAVVDPGMVHAATQQLAHEAVDGYDLFLMQAARVAGITQILTDDSDYTTVAGITVFTSNRNAISAASQQGRLVRR